MKSKQVKAFHEASEVAELVHAGSATEAQVYYSDYSVSLARLQDLAMKLVGREITIINRYTGPGGSNFGRETQKAVDFLIEAQGKNINTIIDLVILTANDIQDDDIGAYLSYLRLMEFRARSGKEWVPEDTDRVPLALRICILSRSGQLLRDRP